MIAVEDAWRRWYPISREQSRRILGCVEEADAVAHQAFVRFWQAGVVGADALVASAWLYRTTSRLAIGRLQTPGSRGTRGDAASSELAAPGGRPRALERLVGSLSGAELELAALRSCDRLDRAEVGEVLGRSERAARGRLAKLARHPAALAVLNAEGETHPSFLSLDRLVLGTAAPAVVAHGRHCPACRGHIERLLTAPPLPDRLRGLDAPRGWRPHRGPGGCRRLVLLGLAGASATVVLGAAVATEASLPGAEPAPAPSLETSHPPRVTVWIRHGAEFRMWDELSPLRPGSSIDVEIDPGPHAWFALLRAGEGNPVDVGTLAPRNRRLVSIRLADTVADPETFVVVLADGPLARDRLLAASRGEVPDAETIRVRVLKDAKAGGANG